MTFKIVASKQQRDKREALQSYGQIYRNQYHCVDKDRPFSLVIQGKPESANLWWSILCL